MMLIGKLIGLMVVGAVLTIPMGVMLRMAAASFKVRDDAVMAIAAVLAFVTAGALVFGSSGPLTGAHSDIDLERQIAGLRADMHEAREACQALAISLAAETQEFRNKQFSECMEGVLADEKVTFSLISDLNKQIERNKEPVLR